MKGQWLGRIAGSNTGYLAINIDHDRPAVAILQVDDPKQPFAAYADLTVSGSTVSGILTSFLPKVGTRVPNPVSGLTLPTTGSFVGTITGSTAAGTWSTNAPSSGSFTAQLLEPQKALAADHSFSWPELRDWLFSKREGQAGWIFRGQERSDWPLTSTFHRSGRRNLFRYDREDVPRLQRFLEATIGERYVLNDPLDYGALLNLGQHHGFPTPLMDWTESPFVAAYFAFAGLPKHPVGPEAPPVRLFGFDRTNWPSQHEGSILVIRPCVAPLELGARDNPRALPQQSVNLFTNIVDIEGFIALREASDSRRFLLRIDVPASERTVAMRELAMMGITAASLFPGVTGVCAALSERWF